MSDKQEEEAFDEYFEKHFGFRKPTDARTLEKLRQTLIRFCDAKERIEGLIIYREGYEEMRKLLLQGWMARSLCKPETQPYLRDSIKNNPDWSNK